MFGARFELAAMRFSTARVCRLRHPNIGGQSRIRTLDVSRRVTGSTARRFQPLSQLPKHELSKIWRKAGDSNAYVPRDPGLADQWDTNYPNLPGTNSRCGFEGNYRLSERHQACPTESRYDRRPRLKKCRIYGYSTAKHAVQSRLVYWQSHRSREGCGPVDPRRAATRTE